MPTYPLILAIDTSCDDTSVAVTRGTRVLSNVIASQTELHKPYGGVFPTVAKLAHRENLEPAVAVALKRAHVSINEIDQLAVTVGPGLAPALEVGIAGAKKIALEHNKPLTGVNHIEGHLLSVLASPSDENMLATVQFPVLSVIVSGGHTQFVLVLKFGHYEILGTTLDDAAGECLDKIGRMLGLGYPAGPVIEEFAKLGDKTAFPFPLPLTTVKTYDVSFSGMKTFARNELERVTATAPLTKQQIYDFAASAQYAVFRHICYKLNKILQWKEISAIWLGGGVAANRTLRAMLRTTLREHSRLHQLPSKRLYVPYTKKLCADNAAMIGIVAGLKAAHSSAPSETFSAAGKVSETMKLETTEKFETLERQPRLKL